MTTTDFTVCICVLNGEDHLDACIQSLLASAGDVEFPVVIIDHNSSDRTGALLASWQRRLGSRLRVDRFGAPGLAAARNRAWQLADTDWVAFIDVDCRAHAGWIAAVRQGIEKARVDPTCAAFGGQNLAPRHIGLLYEAYALFLPTFVGGHGAALNRPIDGWVLVDHLPTLNVVYRRDQLVAVDGFDTRFLRVGEDLDLSFRLRQRGATMRGNPGMVVDHLLRPTVGAWLKNMLLYGAGRCLFIRRHPSSFHAKFLIPPILVVAYLGTLCLPPLTIALAVAHAAGVALLLLPAKVRGRFSLAAWGKASAIVWLTHMAYGWGYLREQVFKGKSKEAGFVR